MKDRQQKYLLEHYNNPDTYYAATFGFAAFFYIVLFLQIPLLQAICHKRETWKGGQVENKTVKKVYEVEEIQNILGISRSAAYELIRETYKMQHPFKVLKIGNLYRVPKVPFDNWLNGETE